MGYEDKRGCFTGVFYGFSIGFNSSETIAETPLESLDMGVERVLDGVLKLLQSPAHIVLWADQVMCCKASIIALKGALLP